MAERITRRQLLVRGAAALGGFAALDRARDVHALDMLGERLARARTDTASSCLQGARIRWIVGWSPGGGFDTYSRLAEPFIEKTLGAQIVIDNMPGAGGRVGALALSRARPDGRTLGILNGSGFLWERTASAGPAPDLLRDFTVLARVAARQQVLVANAATGVRSVDDLIAFARRRTIVAGITAGDSANFATLAAVSDLLGLPVEFVSGYAGSREVILGLLRGDCDITSLDSESFAQVPDLARTHALLQITPERAPDARMADVPHLAGTNGLITVRPELFTSAGERARALTAAIAAYLEFGRLFAAPGRMATSLRDCLEHGITSALSDPAFVSAAQRAGRSIDIISGAEVRRRIPAAMQAVRPIAPVAAAAARRIR